jgi:hypothetical protein
MPSSHPTYFEHNTTLHPCMQKSMTWSPSPSTALSISHTMDYSTESTRRVPYSWSWMIAFCLESWSADVLHNFRCFPSVEPTLVNAFEFGHPQPTRVYLEFRILLPEPSIVHVRHHSCSWNNTIWKEVSFHPQLREGDATR